MYNLKTDKITVLIIKHSIIEIGVTLAKIRQNLVLHGTVANKGIAFGKLSFVKRADIGHEKKEIKNTKAECARFEKARLHAITQLGALYDASLEILGEQNAVVFQIHQMMLEDPDYVSSINEVITKEHTNAEYAVTVVAQKFEKQFLEMDNDYMRGRAADIVDISRRINEILMMHDGILNNKGISYNHEGSVVLAADDLVPSETVQLDQKAVAGIVTSKGSNRSHTAIFARTMGIPTIVCVGDSLTEDLEGHFVIIVPVMSSCSNTRDDSFSSKPLVDCYLLAAPSPDHPTYSVDHP